MRTDGAATAVKHDAIPALVLSDQDDPYLLGTEKNDRGITSLTKFTLYRTERPFAFPLLFLCVSVCARVPAHLGTST